LRRMMEIFLITLFFGSIMKLADPCLLRRLLGQLLYSSMRPSYQPFITNYPSLSLLLPVTPCPLALPHLPRIPTLPPFSMLPWKLTNGCPIQEFRNQLIRNTKPVSRAGAIGGNSPLRVRGFRLQLYAWRRSPRFPDKDEFSEREVIERFSYRFPELRLAAGAKQLSASDRK
jgi:hypothetical protein